MSTDRAPIVIFAYKRPDLLSRMLSSLVLCKEFETSPLHIFVDGPRTASDEAGVQAVRQLVRSSKLPRAEVRFSDVNIGLRQSIADGVTQVCDRYGRAIILEEDLLLSPIALTYFNEALNRYHDDPRIWSIGGYTYDAPQLRDYSRALVLPYAHPWGWATWSRAWRAFNLSNAPSVQNLRSSAFRSAFDVFGLYPFSVLLEQSCHGKVNSWFIHWYYTIFSHGGRTVFPPRRVVDNYGFGKDGTHNSVLNPYDYLVRRPALLEQTVNLESVDPAFVDYWALDYMRRSHELRVQRFIARSGQIKRIMKRSTSR